MKKTLIIFLGPPGSGKGTQTAYLSEKIGIPVISTGVLFREEIKNETEIGKLVQKKLSEGQLIETEITNKILSKRLEGNDIENGYILDGYPRKKDQIEFAVDKIDNIIKEGGKALVYHVDISDSIVKKRISGRRICQCGESYHTDYNPPKKKDVCDICGEKLKQRSDDSEESVEKRLSEFYKENGPVFEFFKDKDYFHKINGDQYVEKVREAIWSFIIND